MEEELSLRKRLEPSWSKDLFALGQTEAKTQTFESPPEKKE